MSSKAAALLLIGGICLLAASIPRGHSRAGAHRVHRTERPWLSRDAQDQLIGADGEPGPLFGGVTLGGPAPQLGARSDIADFADANGIDIRLEVKDDTLVAIRATMTFGGCCGYEAIDVLGLRLSRPRIYECGDCSRYTPVDDWAYEPEPGLHVRFHTHVNQLSVRWEPALSTDEVLDTVEAMMGTSIDKVKRSAGDRMTEWQPHDYTLELPYDHERPASEGYPKPGMMVHAHAGVVTQVRLDVYAAEPAVDAPEGEPLPIEKLLRARFGRPHVDGESGEWSWHRHGYVITANAYSSTATVTIDAVDPVARR